MMKNLPEAFIRTPYVCALFLWALISLPLFSRAVMAQELSGEELWELSKRVTAGEERYAKAKRYGEGGLHYLGHLLFQQGAEEIAQKTFLQSSREEESPWKELSLRDLGWMLMEAEQWQEVLDLTKKASLEYRDMRFLQLSALYRLRRYKELQKELKNTGDLRPLIWNRVSEQEFSFELQLWTIVMQYERGDAQWIHSLQLVIDEWEASFYHTRLHVYFSQKDIPENFLTNKLLRLLKAKHLLYSGGAAEAYEAFIFDDGLPADFSSALIRDFYNAAMDAQKVSAGAQWLYHSVGNSREKAAEFEYAGRLFYAAEQYEESLNALERSWEEGDTQTYKRRKWYWFRTLVHKSSREAASRFSEIMPVWRQDPPYFDDVLDDLLSALINIQAWQEVLTVFYHIRGRDNAAKASYATVLSLVEGDPSLLEVAYDQESSLSFHAIAATLLNRPIRLPIRADEGVVDQSSLPQTLVHQYLDVHLPFLAEKVFEAHIRKSSPSVILGMSDALISAGKAYTVIRHFPSPGKNEAFMKRYYPLAFSREINAGVGEGNIPPELIYALIREESRFSPDIQSAAGAIGLMQLLPSTAFQVLDELNETAVDLTNPATNIRVGTYYLNRMLQRFSSPSLAIAAYNAGPSRLSQWLSRTSHRGVVFSASIVYRETRRHVFKVFESLLWYQVFSGEDSLQGVVEWYFGNEY